MTRAQQLRPEPGPAFGGTRHPGRRRIAGASEGNWPTPLAAHAADSWLLCDERPLVFDADLCTFEGRTLTRAQDFAAVLCADGLARVNGAFALAFRSRAPDGSTQLQLARDAIGHRTLYYTLLEGRLLFATSLFALRDLRRNVQIDLRAVAAYLSCAYVPERRTIAHDICELLPGELVSFSRGQLRRRWYWQLPAEPQLFVDADSLQATLRRELEDEVGRMLPADGRVAASLSGGIDSSLVVALAARMQQAPVHTYSISFGAGYANELPFSGLVAAHCGTQHHVVELTPKTVLAHLDDTMACLDKPNGDPLTVPNALLFRTMSEHAAVALNGEGGDPCFGGPKNLPMILAELYGESDAHTAETREQSYLRAHQKCFDDLPDLLTAEVLKEACTPPLEADLTPWFVDSRYRTLIARLMAINVSFKGGHHILPKIDALSAPFGVLPRSPLFAKPIVERAFAIPSGLKLRGSVEKYLLKEAARELLPAPIVERPKSGMMVPVEAWFKDALLPAAKARILDGLSPYGLFHRQKLEDLLDGVHGGLRPRRGVKIWLLVTLEAHLRTLRAR